MLSVCLRNAVQGSMPVAATASYQLPLLGGNTPLLSLVHVGPSDGVRNTRFYSSSQLLPGPSSSSLFSTTSRFASPSSFSAPSSSSSSFSTSSSSSSYSSSSSSSYSSSSSSSFSTSSSSSSFASSLDAKREKYRSGNYTFWDVVKEQQFLFYLIPVAMMLVRGVQEMNWPEIPATVVSCDEEENTITYRYFAGSVVIEHTQKRNNFMTLLEKLYHQKDLKFQRGDRILIHINPKNPRISVFRPLPIAVWHLGMFVKYHPQLGTTLQSSSSSSSSRVPPRHDASPALDDENQDGDEADQGEETQTPQ